jgi:hypothetical protein
MSDTPSPLATLDLIELRKAMLDARAIADSLPTVVLHPDTAPEVGGHLEVDGFRLEVVRSRFVRLGEMLVIRRDLLHELAGDLHPRGT